jgi:hypothetical protein
MFTAAYWKITCEVGPCLAARFLNFSKLPDLVARKRDRSYPRQLHAKAGEVMLKVARACTLVMSETGSDKQSRTSQRNCTSEATSCS